MTFAGTGGLPPSVDEPQPAQMILEPRILPQRRKFRGHARPGEPGMGRLEGEPAERLVDVAERRMRCSQANRAAGRQVLRLGE